ncbi:hypothetical protein Y032_0106g3754 [Ancylostoma ceylanicum]|nr:hypothetical protein Y032_0106g3754 [Ancylostoma ceylanicum]
MLQTQGLQVPWSQLKRGVCTEINQQSDAAHPQEHQRRSSEVLAQVQGQCEPVSKIFLYSEKTISDGSVEIVHKICTVMQSA